MGDIKAVVFDAYGTLFDVHSVVEACNQLFPGKGQELSIVWRNKQLEYTWLRSLMGRYKNFREVTEDGLIYACKSLGLTLNTDNKQRLMDEYLRLNPYPEVPDVLKQLDGKKRAIFSNGSLDILEPLVEHAGLKDLLDDILTVDDVKVYKPEPRSYTVILEKMNIAREEVLFISSNTWDVAGAKSFGFQVAWVKRGKKYSDVLGQTPDFEIKDLRGIDQYLQK